ncbi:hypothetical protein RRG08_048600 [Elysia crispata]|uniref:Uncharacterized protein n=1 Tax=Elysia crispata TaxID=231223 RepID=A0AAE1ACR0_9GAST|nr:hypothetical protein RRG08_048600 [Elysia crispata]
MREVNQPIELGFWAKLEAAYKLDERLPSHFRVEKMELVDGRNDNAAIRFSIFLRLWEAARYLLLPQKVSFDKILKKALLPEGSAAFLRGGGFSPVVGWMSSGFQTLHS